MEHSGPDAAGEPAGGGESTLTVLLAMGVNLAIAIAKAVAGVLSGSAAMLSEAAHSVADTITELLLLVALRRSARPADRTHPFGYGKERYVWSLLAAVSIFTAGALFSAYQGWRTLTQEQGAEEDFTVAIVVLLVAIVLESVSLAQAVRQVRGELRRDRLGLRTWLRRTDDPTVKSVLLEDSAAIIGLLVALAGVWLTHVTGSHLWDGLASLAIAGVLAGVALSLGRTNVRLLTGRQADPRLVRALHDRLLARPEVDAVVDLLTMTTGTGKVLLCARLDFDDRLGAAEVERAVVDAHIALRREFADLDEVFLEPVPRTDEVLRERAFSRYGAPIGTAELDG